jgi:murein DD-endopeptidase MepM/ murein hydrolase activator NlpD
MGTTVQRFFIYIVVVLVIAIFLQSAAIVGMQFYSAKAEPYATHKSFSNEYILALEDFNTEQPTPSQVIKRVTARAATNISRSRASDVIPPPALFSVEKYPPDRPAESGVAESVSVELEIGDILRTIQEKKIGAATCGNTDRTSNEVYHVVKKGDTLRRIAALYSVEIDQIRRLNDLSEDSVLKEGRKLMISTGNNYYYVVAPGETLWTVAQKFQARVSELVEVNGLKIDTVVSGQKLRIPNFHSNEAVSNPLVEIASEKCTDQDGGISASQGNTANGNDTKSEFNYGAVAEQARKLLSRTVPPSETTAEVLAPGSGAVKEKDTALFGTAKNENSAPNQFFSEEEVIKGTTEVEMTGGDTIVNPEESLRECIREERLTRIVLKKSKVDKPLADQAKSVKLSWPLNGPVSSPFGMRIHPIREVVCFHEGVDIAANIGRPIKAAADGIVSFAGTKGGYGKVVYISHKGGYQTRYAHCSKLLVEKGEKIRRGQVIGYVGITGVTTGPHVHFEVRRDGRAKDPLLQLRALN